MITTLLKKKKTEHKFDKLFIKIMQLQLSIQEVTVGQTLVKRRRRRKRKDQDQIQIMMSMVSSNCKEWCPCSPLFLQFDFQYYMLYDYLSVTFLQLQLVIYLEMPMTLAQMRRPRQGSLMLKMMKEEALIGRDRLSITAY